jgi:trk system potassium uptake protein TrkH
MTISTFVALLMGQNLGLRGEFAIGEMMGERRSRSALRLVRFIVLSTMVAETLGALVLTGSFLRQGRPLATAAGLGVFHSVSAFCNAGFSTFGDNLAGSANARPAILLPVSLLIILGGLGFSVIYAVFRRLRHAEPLSLHARIVLAMTAALLGGGAIFFWLLERNHGLRATTLPLSWLHAWFQSVTTRTAGFNSVDITALSPITQITMILLMYIGAAPGSTAGGIKVTTAAVLLLLVRSLVRRETGLVAGGRKITLATVQQAAGLLVLSLAVITGAWLLLLWTERQPALPLLFEAVSAFGTVGLSLNVTPTLTGGGKLVVVLLMFTGRVGLLTLLMMIRPEEVRPRIDYPGANVMVG